MSEAHAEDIRKHVRIYIVVFVSLAVLTVVTVAVSYLDHSMAVGITVALLIAAIKGSLVACYFMHLISEKKLIYSILVLTVVFFIGLMFLPLSAFLDHTGSGS
jgi:cytochrome c oxidase subunit 4